MVSALDRNEIEKPMKSLSIAAFIILVSLSPFGAKASEKWCDSENKLKSDRLPCFAKVISWVEFSHQGDHAETFTENKSSLESFARMRIRNDISSLEHEVLSFDEAIKKYNFDMGSKELKERIALQCKVWWVGNDFPVAQHVECSLWGYGSYKGFEVEMETSILGYSNSRILIEQTKDSVRSIVGTLASAFYDSLDMADD